MSGTVFRSGVERSYPLPHAGPEALNSVAAVLVGYGFPRLTAPDRAALKSALVAFLYNPQEIDA